MYSVSGLTTNIPIIREKYVWDDLHPNTYAHREKLAPVFSAYIEMI